MENLSLIKELVLWSEGWGWEGGGGWPGKMSVLEKYSQFSFLWDVETIGENPIPGCASPNIERPHHWDPSLGPIQLLLPLSPKERDNMVYPQFCTMSFVLHSLGWIECVSQIGRDNVSVRNLYHHLYHLISSSIPNTYNQRHFTKIALKSQEIYIHQHVPWNTTLSV